LYKDILEIHYKIISYGSPWYLLLDRTARIMGEVMANVHVAIGVGQQLA
jgi:hypothetical protein